VVFNYLVHNGDAHLKNFSLIRNEQTGEYNLSPAYDLLNTRLHLPNESPTALDLFKDGFETESYRINGYYAHDDFIAFAQKLGLVESRTQRFLKSIISKRDDIFSLINCSLLPDDCKQLYRVHFDDRLRACSYSHS
jgi:serine/threonine-protein kinase HipA